MKTPKTPIKSIRAYCLECCGGSSLEVRLCVIPHCALFPYRFGKRPPKDFQPSGKVLTPVKAIRARCLDCACFAPSQVRRCFIPECHLYSYRMGKNPNFQKEQGESEDSLPVFLQKSGTKLPSQEDNSRQTTYALPTVKNGSLLGGKGEVLQWTSCKLLSCW